MFSQQFLSSLEGVSEGKVVARSSGRKGKKAFVEGRAGKLSYYVAAVTIEALVEKGHIELDGQKRGSVEPEWVRFKIRYNAGERPVFAHYYTKSRTIRFRCGENFGYRLAESLGFQLDYVTETAKLEAGARTSGNKRMRSENGELLELAGSIEDDSSDIITEESVELEEDDNCWVDAEDDPDDDNEGALYPVTQGECTIGEEVREGEINTATIALGMTDTSFETVVSPAKGMSMEGDDRFPIPSGMNDMNLRVLKDTKATENNSQGLSVLTAEKKIEVLEQRDLVGQSQDDSGSSRTRRSPKSEGQHRHATSDEISSLDIQSENNRLTKEKLQNLKGENETKNEMLVDLMKQLLNDRKELAAREREAAELERKKGRTFELDGPELTVEEQGEAIRQVISIIFPELHIPAACIVHNDLNLLHHFTDTYFAKIRKECGHGHLMGANTSIPAVPALNDETTVQIDASAIIDWLKTITESNFVTRSDSLFRIAWQSLTTYFKKAEETIWSERFKKADLSGLTHTDKFLKFYNSAVALSKLSCSSSDHEVMRQQINKLVNAIYRYPTIAQKQSPITTLISYIEDIIFSRVSVTSNAATKERVFQSERELIRELVISVSPQLAQVFAAIELADGINPDDNENNTTRLVVQDYETLLLALRKLSVDKSSRREIVLRKPKGKYRAIDLTVSKLRVATAPLSLEELSIKLSRLDEKLTRGRAGGLKRMAPDEEDDADFDLFDDEGMELLTADLKDYDNDKILEGLGNQSDSRASNDFFGTTQQPDGIISEVNDRNNPLKQATKEKILIDYLSSQLGRVTCSNTPSEAGSHGMIMAITPDGGNRTPTESLEIPKESATTFEGGKDGQGEISMDKRFRYATYKRHPALAMATTHDEYGLAYKTVKFKEGNERKYVDKFSKSWCILHVSGSCPYGRTCALSHPVVSEIAKEKCRGLIGDENLATMRDLARKTVNLYAKKYFRRTYGSLADASYEDMVRKFDRNYKELTTEKMNEVTISGKSFHGGKTVSFPIDTRLEMNDKETEIVKNAAFAAAEIQMDF